MSEDKRLGRTMQDLGDAARKAASVLRETSREAKDRALGAAAGAIRKHMKDILAANADDMVAVRSANVVAGLQDRLSLNEARIEAMAKGLEEVAALPDPVGRELARWKRPNGLDIARIATPLGVIAMIYESRPNVTADAGALCLKSGNAVILRGGSDSMRSIAAIHTALVEGLVAAGLPASAIQLVKTQDRAAVGLLLEGLGGTIDLIVPRGGKELVARVQAEARVPVLAHLEGVCHVYVHERAHLAMARAIVLNAKMRRTGICGAAESLLVDRSVLVSHGMPILEDLARAGCEIRGDEEVCSRFPLAKHATDDDWHTEYLDATISVKTVDGVDDAMRHIATFGSHHTESIVTDDALVAQCFLATLDSAIVMWNASTQFSDGGEFGMGAEIGIGTGKLHARGPVGAEQLTTFKYIVRGTGQTRP